MGTSFCLLPQKFLNVAHLTIPKGARHGRQRAAAAEEAWRTLTEAVEVFEGINYSEVRSELPAPDDDESSSLHLLEPLCRFREAQENAQEAYFQLRALELLERGVGREEARIAVAGEPWPCQAEITTRFAWMKSHDELMDEGIHPSGGPYRCRVPTRADRGYNETNDREFWVLLCFLPRLIATGSRDSTEVFDSKTWTQARRSSPHGDT